jgi:hypothetical protein
MNHSTTDRRLLAPEMRRTSRVRGTLALVIVTATMVMAGCGDGGEAEDRSTDEASPTTGAAEATSTTGPPVLNLADAFEIPEPGTCFSPSPQGPNTPEEIELIACDEPHEAEVIGSFTAAADEWPGDPSRFVDAITSGFGVECTTAAGEYGGSDLQGRLSAEPTSDPDSALIIHMLIPPQDAWDAGDRTVGCVIASAAGDSPGALLTRSFRA